MEEQGPEGSFLKKGDCQRNKRGRFICTEMLSCYFKTKMSFYPTEIRYLLLKGCQLKCFFCHSEGGSKERQEIPFDVLINEIEQNSEYLRIIHLTGGEPLLYSHFDETIKHLKKKNNFTIHVTTNGLLMREKQDILKDVDGVHISLNSLNPDKYGRITRNKKALPIVLEAIKNSPELFTEINFLPIKYPHNLEELPDLIEFARTNGVHAINVLKMALDQNNFIPYSAVRALLKKRYKEVDESTVLRHGHPVDRLVIDGVEVNLCDIRVKSDFICGNCPLDSECDEGLYHPRMFFSEGKAQYKLCLKSSNVCGNYNLLKASYVGSPKYSRRE